MTWYSYEVGTSFIDYRGRGFWTCDSKIEVWLCLLCQEINEAERVPDWLVRARGSGWLVNLAERPGQSNSPGSPCWNDI